MTKRLFFTVFFVLVATAAVAGVTLFPGGVSNTDRAGPLATMGQLDPAQFHTYFDDFDYYDSAEWTVTTTENGSGTASEAIQDADGGILKVTTDDNATTDNDYLQFGSETFQMESGEAAWFSASVNPTNAGNSTLVFGMQITDTSPMDVTEGIFFKVDGDSQLDFYVEDGDSSVGTNATNVDTLTSNATTTVSWYYNGVDEVSYAVNGVILGHVGVTNLPTDAADDLTVSFGLDNNAQGTTPSMSIDYIMMSKER